MLADDGGFNYENSNSDSILLNSFTYPFSEELDISITDERGDRRPKMQDHGEWPTTQYHGGMDIHAEGDILGESSEDFFANRIEFVSIIRFKPTGLGQIQGILSIDFIGSTELWQAEIDQIIFAAPLLPNSPARCAYQVTFHSPLPYFLGADTDTIYYYS